MTPQIIYLSLLFTGMLLEANRHGKEKKGCHNFWTASVSFMLQALLMYWGGFFDVFFK